MVLVSCWSAACLRLLLVCCVVAGAGGGGCRKKYFDVLVLIRVVRRRNKVLVDAQCVRPNKNNKRPVMFFPKKSVPRVSTKVQYQVRSVPKSRAELRSYGQTKFKVGTKKNNNQIPYKKYKILYCVPYRTSYRPRGHTFKSKTTVSVKYGVDPIPYS